jgi:hypothetical protein
MNNAATRSILRWIHLVLAIPIAGYVYSPFEDIPQYAAPNPVCLPSCTCPDGIVDVERPCRSATRFE